MGESLRYDTFGFQAFDSLVESHFGIY